MDKAARSHDSASDSSWTGGGAEGIVSGFVPNVLATLLVQTVTVLIVLTLFALGFPEEATVVLFVLGVLVTAVITEGPAYSIVASALSVITFNFFIVEPRMSLRAWGPDYPETFAVMFVVALVASYLVSKMRSNARASTEATVKARNEQMRADLLRSVSHDLRTPLTSIMGNADLLLSNDSDLSGEARARIVRDIHDDATWLTDVVENLLAITRFDKDAVSLSMRTEAVDEVVESALRHVRRDVSGHAIIVTPSEELLFARMDAQVIVQVIVNLVNNALAHTPTGCVVEIVTRRVGGEVWITVRDDGPGIAEEERERVFEPFYTSKDVLTDGRRGIGLGLALSKTIAEAHGGRIWVDAVEPHGAAFTLALPLEEVSDDE